MSVPRAQADSAAYAVFVYGIAYRARRQIAQHTLLAVVRVDHPTRAIHRVELAHRPIAEQHTLRHYIVRAQKYPCRASHSKIHGVYRRDTRVFVPPRQSRAVRVLQDPPIRVGQNRCAAHDTRRNQSRWTTVPVRTVLETALTAFDFAASPSSIRQRHIRVVPAVFCPLQFPPPRVHFVAGPEVVAPYAPSVPGYTHPVCVCMLPCAATVPGFARAFHFLPDFAYHARRSLPGRPGQSTSPAPFRSWSGGQTTLVQGHGTVMENRGFRVVQGLWFMV
eukprot:441000-Rhodomonas_salina.2